MAVSINHDPMVAHQIQSSGKGKQEVPRKAKPAVIFKIHTKAGFPPFSTIRAPDRNPTMFRKPAMDRSIRPLGPSEVPSMVAMLMTESRMAIP